MSENEKFARRERVAICFRGEQQVPLKIYRAFRGDPLWLLRLLANNLLANNLLADNLRLPEDDEVLRDWLNDVLANESCSNATVRLRLICEASVQRGR